MFNKISIHLNESQMEMFKFITDRKVGMFVDIRGHGYELTSIFFLAVRKLPNRRINLIATFVLFSEKLFLTYRPLREMVNPCKYRRTFI